MPDLLGKSSLVAWAVLGLGMAVVCSGEERETPRTIAPPTRLPDPARPTEVEPGAPVAIASVPREVRRAVAEDAARRFRVPTSAVVLSRAERVTWPNGSLGCAEPGNVHTQVLVPGFRLVATSTEGNLTYHTDTNGRLATCTNALFRESSDPSVPTRPVEPRTGPRPPAPPDR